MSFSAVVGQDAAVAALEAHLARTGGAGSTLIVGEEGVGRYLLARCAARRILGDDALVEAGRHPDLALLDPTEGIDGVRATVTTLQRRPALADRQVLLVRDADRFGTEALNALLKTLEEPPGGAAIFLVASDPALLPETVVSRCRVVRARALTEAETARVLEGLDVPPELARDAAGAPGRALFHHEHGVGADATRLVELLLRRCPDPLAEADALVKKRKEEESRDHRRRLQEILRVAATRLRRDLPDTEYALRLAVEALGSVNANANPGILFAELALTPWRRNNSPRA